MKKYNDVTIIVKAILVVMIIIAIGVMK